MFGFYLLSFQTHQCLVTCGKGMKHRLVTCMGGGEEKLSEQYCDSSTKPPAVESCQLPECASWQVGIWGVVSYPHADTKKIKSDRQVLDSSVCRQKRLPVCVFET